MFSSRARVPASLVLAASIVLVASACAANGAKESLFSSWVQGDWSCTVSSGFGDDRDYFLMVDDGVWEMKSSNPAAVDSSGSGPFEGTWTFRFGDLKVASDDGSFSPLTVLGIDPEAEVEDPGSVVGSLSYGEEGAVSTSFEVDGVNVRISLSDGTTTTCSRQ